MTQDTKDTLKAVALIVALLAVGITAMSALVSWSSDRDALQRRRLDALPCHNGPPTADGCPHARQTVSFTRNGSPVCECPIVRGER